ncbi:FxsA family protein [Gordonia sp. YC-JH1]|uniref:FxsA family protein n=1 Tax=Gordonia sp. YC-JH1 TaxID=2059875 RepID=UPI001F191F36|nr:FxsA family protein [Gordonia sp. YC-JH1]
MRYLFVGYVIAEIAAFWAMAHFLGFAWAFLITVLAAGVGFAVLGRRARTLGTDMRKAMRNEIGAGRPITDSALFAVTATLMILPGIVSTIVGLLLMTPPARRLLRPVVAATAARRATAMAGRMTVIDLGAGPPAAEASGSAGTVTSTGRSKAWSWTPRCATRTARFTPTCRRCRRPAATE